MKNSVFIASSLDGYIARENGELDWLPGADGKPIEGLEENDDLGFDAFMNAVDVLVMGRNTFEAALTFESWPYVNMPVVVLSSTLSRLPADIPESVSLRNSSPKELVQELETTGYKHAYIDGGKTIQRFLAARLIDEMCITTIPVLLGGGIPLFGEMNRDIQLKLVESKSFANGMLQTKYRVLRN
ncbi:MAG: dihydrofolate reductase family protein [Candidatus Marinimicrobia bacterium]|nr:dihydrofolate reductase family protein [Candidatus Neomarinimicrobiota bacterium]MCF7840815.1 dihydrofolate reductase family protein [Candidatus Neomarinimicrobiota bacterium]MCF7903209.1 dihydrofolate reductase family protein [Candidatus Neomarinimicrobiota bacterium]